MDRARRNYERGMRDLKDLKTPKTNDEIEGIHSRMREEDRAEAMSPSLNASQSRKVDPEEAIRKTGKR